MAPKKRTRTTPGAEPSSQAHQGFSEPKLTCETEVIFLTHLG